MSGTTTATARRCTKSALYYRRNVHLYWIWYRDEYYYRREWNHKGRLSFACIQNGHYQLILYHPDRRRNSVVKTRLTRWVRHVKRKRLLARAMPFLTRYMIPPLALLVIDYV